MSDRPRWQPAARAGGDSSSLGVGAYTDSDVLTGRDKMALVHPGNKFFRTLIHMHRPAYLSARKRHNKTDIINAIISTVWENGGRFLTLEPGIDPNGPAVWSELESYEIHHKVSHALRAVKNKSSGAEKMASSIKSSDTTAEKTEPCSSTTSSRSRSAAASPTMDEIDKELAAAVAEVTASEIGPLSMESTSSLADAELASQAMMSMATQVDLSSQGPLAPSHDLVFSEGWTTDQWRQLVASEMLRRSLVRAAVSRHQPSVEPLLLGAAGVSAPALSWTSHPASNETRSCPELTTRSSFAVTESAMSSEMRTERRSRLSLPLASSAAHPTGPPDFSFPTRYARCSSAPASVHRLYDTDNEEEDEEEDAALDVSETKDEDRKTASLQQAPVAAELGDAGSSTSTSSHSFFTLDGKRAEF